MLGHSYFGMWGGYQYGFEQAGCEVVTHIYDQRAGISDKATYVWQVYRHKLQVGRTPFEVLRARFNAEVEQALRKHNYEAVVVFSGALIDPSLFSPLVDRGMPVVMWLEDQLDRHVFLDAESLSLYSGVATFSPRDAKALRADGVNAHLVPFGFDDRFRALGSPRLREVVFVGARDDYRSGFLENLTAQGVPVRAYGQQWSRNPIARIRDRQWSRPQVKGGPRVNYTKAKRVYWDGLAALNLHVPTQDLVNPRTFDIAGVGGLQLVDRSDSAEYYDPHQEILVFSSVSEAVDLVNRARNDPDWAQGIRVAARRRTLAEHTIGRRCRRMIELFYSGT